jgi:phosphatidylserine decarboxylase precursor-related protein
MISLTFRDRNPYLYTTLMIGILISLLVLNTYSFSIFIVSIWVLLEYFYRLPVFPYGFSRKALNKLDYKLGLIHDKTIDPEYILSPCYGTIKAIEVYRDYTRIISVLSVLDVHYQFCPIDGIVKNITHKDGEFYLAYLLDKSRYNERCHTIFSNSRGLSVEVIQIAGMLTRRIDTSVRIGNRVEIGTPYGLIHFGSRVDTIVPNRYNNKPINVLVKVGSRLQGPLTRLCQF